MSVQGIIEKIIGDAKAEARKIVAEAEGEAASIRKRQGEEAAEYYERQKGLLEERYRKEKERAVLNKRLETRKNMLGARQRWMDKAFDEAYKRLIEQPLSEYKRTLVGLIGAVSQAKDEEIVFGKKGDVKFFEEVVRDLNGKTGGHFTLSFGNGNFPWGFILRKGKVAVNMSIDSLFKYRRADLEQTAWEMFNAQR